MIERLNTLNKVINSGKYIVICNLMGLLRYLPDKNLYKSKIVNLGVNDDVNRDELINSFFELGYDKVPLVTKTGEMAVRGYVVDIFPIGFDNPVRIEFWAILLIVLNILIWIVSLQISKLTRLVFILLQNF